MPHPEPTSLIWLITSKRSGDNAQTLTLGRALGLPSRIKQVFYKNPHAIHRRPLHRSIDQLSGIEALHKPWPDLIIAMGIEPLIAALWARKQSGGRSKIVSLGCPRLDYEKHLSLMITSRQYWGINHPKILPLNFPLLHIDQAIIAQAGAKWWQQFARLPKPLTAVMIGGATRFFQCDKAAIDTLMQAIQPMARKGFVYITTSPRTPADVIQALQAQLPGHTALFEWQPDASDNPYHALLALADRFVVTSDSVSMMMEVAQLGKPLAIFELPSVRLLHRLLNGLNSQRLSAKLLQWPLKLLQKISWAKHIRNPTAIYQLLYKKRLAVPLGNDFLPIHNTQFDGELSQAVARVKQLIESSEDYIGSQRQIR